MHFVNLSLRGNKVSMFTYKYLHKCLRKISKAIYSYRLMAHFILQALCLISWFPIRNKYSHTWHGKTLPADGCFLYNFTDFIFPKNNCMSIRAYKVSMFAHIDPLRLCNFNPSNTSCRHDRRSTTTQQPLEQYVLWRKWGDFRWCYLINIWVVKTKLCDLWKPNAQT